MSLNFRFIAFEELRIEIGFGQISNDFTDLFLLQQPVVPHLMSLTYSKYVHARNDFIFFAINQVNAFLSILAFPVKGTLILIQTCRYVPIGLVLNIKELGRVEPDAWHVFTWIASNRASHRFPHHSPDIPHGFYRFAVWWWVFQLCTVADCINISDIGLQEVVYQNTPIKFEVGVFE